MQKVSYLRMNGNSPINSSQCSYWAVWLYLEFCTLPSQNQHWESTVLHDWASMVPLHGVLDSFPHSFLGIQDITPQ